MMKTSILALALSTPLWLVGCGESAGEDNDEGTHTHADGTVHRDHEDSEDEGHEHGEEVPLEDATIGEMTVALKQAHGAVEPGKQGHLVVKLPYNDDGATTVRAWIGTEDSTLSIVGKGEYAPSHDDYDIHTIAPDPLPENAMWWIEIEKPDGTKAVGKAKPITE